MMARCITKCPLCDCVTVGKLYKYHRYMDYDNRIFLTDDNGKFDSYDVSSDPKFIILNFTEYKLWNVLTGSEL